MRAAALALATLAALLALAGGAHAEYPPDPERCAVALQALPGKAGAFGDLADQVGSSAAAGALASGADLRARALGAGTEGSSTALDALVGAEVDGAAFALAAQDALGPAARGTLDASDVALGGAVHASNEFSLTLIGIVASAGYGGLDRIAALDAWVKSGTWTTPPGLASGAMAQAEGAGALAGQAYARGVAGAGRFADASADAVDEAAAAAGRAVAGGSAPGPGLAPASSALLQGRVADAHAIADAGVDATGSLGSWTLGAPGPGLQVASAAAQVLPASMDFALGARAALGPCGVP